METGTVRGDERPDETLSPSKNISRGMVGLYKEYLGRGPTKAKTWLRDELVVTILEDGLTKAEQTLTESGSQQTVRQIRREFQDSMRDDIVALVERETGRRAVCMLSDHSPDPDYAVELVILAPQGADE
jgi:uncharacterized protein YbcI